MSQTDSIEVQLGYVDVVLNNDFETLCIIDISDEAVELNLNGRKACLSEWDLYYSKIIKLL